MSKTILYPFKINSDFRVGYAWSAELARRLNNNLSLFTTLDPSSPDPTVAIYNELVDAQGFYVKSFQLLQKGLKPVKSERNFVEGEFDSSFLDFVDHRKPEIIVLPSKLFENGIMKKIINSRSKVIVLASAEIEKTHIAKKDRAELFLSLLRHSACYNIPQSFFNTISNDRNIFNSLAAFFRK